MTVHYVDYISELKSSVDLREVVEHYGMKPDRSGYIPCPFHSERTASLKVWHDHFKCFGCGKYGDVISFVQDFLHTDFPGAMETINTEFGLNLPFERTATLKEIRAAQARKRQLEAERSERESKQNYLESLRLAWAEYDRAISEHPVPDNERTARAYRMRDYINYLIYSEDGNLDDSIQSDWLQCS